MRVFLLVAALAVLTFVVFGVAAQHGRRYIEGLNVEYGQGCAAQGFTADQCDWLSRNFKPLWR